MRGGLSGEFRRIANHPANGARHAVRAPGASAQGLEHDVLLVSGGVSAGKYDLVKPALREFGVDFQFEKVRIQPGQPSAFGMANNKPVFGLPGNPGSSMVTYRLFAEPAIRLLAGETEPTLLLLLARFSEPFRHKGGLTRFLPAQLEPDGISVRHIPWQGSSDVPALPRPMRFSLQTTIGQAGTWAI